MKQTLSILICLLLLFSSGALAEKNAFEPCPDSFDEIWEIEDTHAQSEERLVSAVEMNGYRLPFDAGTGTYYCPVGIENGDAWPELNLTVSGAEDLRAIWIDRYTDDSCAQAVENGEIYSFMAVTGENYAYYNVIFTGVGLIDIHCDVDIEGEYVPCTVSIRSDSQENIDSDAMIHLRGGGDLHEAEKVSYRIEFHKTEEDKKKVSVLGLPKDSDWILRAAVEDATVSHDRACWGIWNLWDAGEGRVQLQTKSVEVFVNDEYRGMYELMQRVNFKKEIKAAGWDPDNTVCIRMIHEHNPDEKYPRKASVSMHGSAYQLRYKPDWMTEEEAFALMDDYEKLYTIGSDKLDDESFIALMAKRFDLRELYDYYLFHKTCGFHNNLTNNLYIWITRGEDGEITYHLTPWDMDISWDLNGNGTACSIPYADRLLELSALDSWKILREVYNEKEKQLFGTGAIDGVFDTIRNELQKSGAYQRELALWRSSEIPTDVRNMQYSYYDQLDSIREWMGRHTEDE